MKFTVCFQGKNNQGNDVWWYNLAYKMPETPIGTKGIDFLRQVFPDAKPETISGKIEAAHSSSVTIEISEEMARLIGIFPYDSCAIVNIPDAALNRYMRWVANETLGKTERYSINWNVDKDTLFSDWFKAGCPTKFTPPADPQDLQGQ